MVFPYRRIAPGDQISRFVRGIHIADETEGAWDVVSPPTGYPVLGHMFRGFRGATVNGQTQPAPPMPFNILAGPLFRKTASVHWKGGIGHLATELNATGLWELFRVDAQSVENRAAPLAALHPDVDAALLEGCAAFGPVPAAIEHALVPLVAHARTAPDIVSDGVAAIEAAHGNIRIGELCADLGVSAPTLSKWFREVVGVPAKYFARVMQFNHVAQLILTENRRSLAQMAAEAGFTDQAHFSHVVQEFVLKSPQAFLDSDYSQIATFVRQVDRR